MEDSEESSDEILARLTSAVRQLPCVIGKIMRPSYRKEAVWGQLLIVVNGTVQGTGRVA